MTSWIDDYIKYTSLQESPQAFHKWCAISIIASVLNRRCWLDRRSTDGIVYFTNYPGQVSICLVAGAGKCKKSTAVTIAKQMMKGAAVAIFDGKITPERLLNKLGATGSVPILTVIASELSAFLSKASYNDGLIDILIKLLDCESNPYETQKGVVDITNPCVTMLMATTPYSMGKSIPPQAHDTGFLSRHIFVYSDQPGAAQPLANNTSDVDPVRLHRSQTDYTNLVLYLRRLSALAGPFEWTATGQQWYNKYYRAFRDSPASSGEGYPQRRPDHLARVAMCVQVARRPSLVLDEWALIEADKMLSEIEVDMPRAFAFIGQHANSELQERILKVFRDQPPNGGPPCVDGETLWYRVNRYFGGDQWAMGRQLEALMEAGVLVWKGRDKITNKKIYQFVKEPY